MDIILCEKNNQSYDIATFASLHPQLLDQYRHTLICKSCKGKGYFRRESVNGHAACFGAYHKEGCSYKTISYESNQTDVDDEVKQVTQKQELIHIDFTDSKASADENKTPSTETGEAAANTKTVRHTRHASEAVRLDAVHKSMGDLLRWLTETDTFAKSDVAVSTGGDTAYKAKNIFVSFDDIGDKQLGKWKGFYGVISHADQAIEWLNIANEKRVSIPISRLTDSIQERFSIAESEELSGAKVLVFGKLLKGREVPYKWYIKISRDNPAHIFLKKAA